jgi:presenilin-like A22 family membrane protease
MENKKKIGNKEIIPILLLASLFIIVHLLALAITSPFIQAGVEPAFDNPDDPINIVYIFLILMIFTVIILLISKFWKKQIIQFIILFAIGYTAGYVIFPLLSITLSQNFFITLVLSIILSLFLIIILYKFPEWYVIDITGIIVGAGAIAIFGMSLGIFLIIIFLIGLAVYDAVSVYKTKHMIDLADTVMDLKLPVLLIIPKIRKYSLIKETTSLKKKIKDGKERDAYFMGLGDIVMPGILVAAVYNTIPDGLIISLSVMMGTLIGFVFLMNFVLKGKPQAGLPFLNSGAIAGYILSCFILFGELKGLTISV